MTIKSIVTDVTRSLKNVNGGVDIDMIREEVNAIDSSISVAQIKRALRDVPYVKVIDQKNGIYRIKGRATPKV
jgi:copper chaperone CopZ